MTTVAKECGLSDRGLAKLCERNSIPVLPRGYWAKKAAGQKIKKAPLITLKDNEPEIAILLRKAQHIISNITVEKEKPALSEAIQKAIDRKRLPENQIKQLIQIH